LLECILRRRRTTRRTGAPMDRWVTDGDAPEEPVVPDHVR